MKNLITLMSLTGLILINLNVQATPPDAGKLLETVPSNAIEKTPSSAKVVPTPAKPTNSETTKQSETNKGPTMTVKRFIVSGAKLFPAEMLAGLLDDLLEQPLPLSQILEGVARITKYYHDAGYFVAQAYLPPQSGAKGELRIDVVEGKIGEIRPPIIESDHDGKIGQHLIATLAAQGVIKEQPLNNQKLRDYKLDSWQRQVDNTFDCLCRYFDVGCSHAIAKSIQVLTKRTPN